jgi:hypothetical protein
VHVQVHPTEGWVHLPINWVQPPSKESLQLRREIDVFGALRSIVQG